MNERIKAMPRGVKLAVIFLLICYIALLLVSVTFWLSLTFLIAIFIAIVRIVEYADSDR